MNNIVNKEAIEQLIKHNQTVMQGITCKLTDKQNEWMLEAQLGESCYQITLDVKTSDVKKAVLDIRRGLGRCRAACLLLKETDIVNELNCMEHGVMEIEIALNSIIQRCLFLHYRALLMKHHKVV